MNTSQHTRIVRSSTTHPRRDVFFAETSNDRYRMDSPRPAAGWTGRLFRFGLGLLGFALLSFGNVRYIFSEDSSSAATRWQAGLHVTFDNDAFSGQDDHYTNGFQIWVVSKGLRDHAHGPLGGVGRLFGKLPGQAERGRIKFQSLSLSQRIFTPEDIHDPEPVVDDMPYSGHLLLGLGVSAQSERHLDAWSLQVGVIGPASLAEETQKAVHDLIGGDEPMGWDNQLPNEPVINLGYEHRWRWWRVRGQDWGSDSIITAGAALGNLLTQVQTGIGWRAGYRLPDDFAVPAPFLGEEAIGHQPSSARYDEGTATWVYAHVDASAIAHAAFWDGTLFSDSPSIDRDAVLGRAQIGIHQRLSRVDIDAAFVVQTVPWDNPDDREIDSYGRLGLALRL